MDHRFGMHCCCGPLSPLPMLPEPTTASMLMRDQSPVESLPSRHDMSPMPPARRSSQGYDCASAQQRSAKFRRSYWLRLCLRRTAFSSSGHRPIVCQCLFASNVLTSHAKLNLTHHRRGRIGISCADSRESGRLLRQQDLIKT
jgi:hypothetical protein